MQIILKILFFFCGFRWQVGTNFLKSQNANPNLTFQLGLSCDFPWRRAASDEEVPLCRYINK